MDMQNEKGDTEDLQMLESYRIDVKSEFRISCYLPCSCNKVSNKSNY